LNKPAFFFLIGIFLFAAGCQSAPRKMNAVEIGMPRKEVILLLGTPKKSARQENREILQFALHPSLDAPYAEDQPYWVLLEDGRVLDHGRNQDFSDPSKAKKETEPQIRMA
jgi:hypothetical protein